MVLICGHYCCCRGHSIWITSGKPDAESGAENTTGAVPSHTGLVCLPPPPMPVAPLSRNASLCLSVPGLWDARGFSVPYSSLAFYPEVVSALWAHSGNGRFLRLLEVLLALCQVSLGSGSQVCVLGLEITKALLQKPNPTQPYVLWSCQWGW